MLPHLRTDFNTNSLRNSYTLKDLQRQYIQLHEGIRCIFYDLDAEGDVSGYLHSAGTVWWDAKSEQYRIDMRTVQFSFTPGTDLSVLDDLYIQEDTMPNETALLERTGEAFELSEALTIVGRKLHPGDQAPDFTLDILDGNAIKNVSLSDTDGRVRLLSVVNSLDTPVCHTGTRRWDALLADLPPGVVVYTISMDLPFAQGRWRGDQGAPGHLLLSAHRDTGFGVDYGVLLKEWRLLQRAVFVIDGTGRIVHVEYVADQMAEPDYTAAVHAATRASNGGD